jgi:hypothetical protein
MKELKKCYLCIDLFLTHYMKTKKYLSVLFLAAIMAGCGNKKPDNENIITKRPNVAVSKRPQTVGNYSQKREVEWLGNKYDIIVERKADTSLPIVKCEKNAKYYDNVISLKIMRKDGTEFYSRSFTKSDFSQYVDDSFEKRSALLGIVYYETEGKNLKFAVSVGSPDQMSDEFVPLTMRISNFGSVTITKDESIDVDAAEAEE